MISKLGWTPSQIDRLRVLWADRTYSARDIAVDLGKSRGAVIGKAHRLKLPGRKQVLTPEQLEQAEKRRREARAARDRARSLAGKIRRRGTVIKMLTSHKPMPESLRVPLIELRTFSPARANQCRFIAEEPPGPDYLHCGHETLPGYSYCPHHHQITHRYQSEASPSIQPARRAAA